MRGEGGGSCNLHDQFSVSVTLSYMHPNHLLSPSQPTNGSPVHVKERVERWEEQDTS